MVRCMHCRAAIIGRVSGFALFNYQRPQFCTACGSPYPWASRDERVTRILTLLAESKVREGDRLALKEQLTVLRHVAPDQRTEKLQVAALKALQRVAPEVWTASRPVITSIATSWIRHELKLPDA